MANKPRRGATRRQPAPRAPQPEKKPRRARGARSSRVDIRTNLRSLAANHRTVCLDTLRRLLRTPAATLLTCIVVGVALALPAGLYVALNTVDRISAEWEAGAQVSLFLRQGVSEAEGEALSRSLVARPDIGSMEYVSREAALAEFTALSGFGDVLEALDSNPLPAMIVVLPVAAVTESGQLQALISELQALPQVEQARLDMEWVQRLQGMFAVARQLSYALTAMLAVAVIVVVGNTIKLTIEGRRDEVLVVKLVGGTDAFVRRPFLYTGLWYGIGGGLLAWLIVTAVLVFLSGAVGQLAALYQSDFELVGLGIRNTLLLLVFSALLGLGGAWLAVGRQLSRIKPT